MVSLLRSLPGAYVVLTHDATAGGQAVDSNMNRMLEVVPEHIHDKAGIFMGSYDEVEKVKAFHKK
jgi:fructose-1,6-bisphosphatase